MRGPSLRSGKRPRGLSVKGSMLGGRDANAPETDAPDPDHGIVADPERGAQDLGRVVEGAAAQHPPPANPRAAGIRPRCLGVRAIPVPTPLPDIAMHIVEAPGVGAPGRDRMGLPAAVFPKRLSRN